jgi:predicted ATP-grasp superfamily ATP-dependent carboligase
MNSSKVKPAMNPDVDWAAAGPPTPGRIRGFASLERAELFRFTSRPRLKRPSFVIGWTKDTGAVSPLAADYLIEASGGSDFCQIEPAGFYSVGGVTVSDDVARFPQSRFFYSDQTPIVILRADEPQSNRYEFLGAVLDLAEHYGKEDLSEPGRAEALYTVNGIAASAAHTVARRVFAVFNDAAAQRGLQQLVPAGANWQGPPHVSTYLLWLAGRRHLPGVGLWVEVPFYLSDYEDYQSVKAVASLLGMMLGWDLDVGRLNRLAAEQNEKLAQLQSDPGIADMIHALEEGQSLDRQEQTELSEAAGNILTESS